MELPEAIEIILEGINGELFHIAGGDLQGAEGIGMGYGDAGTSFEDMYESPFETIYNSTAFEIGGRYGGTRENMFEFSLAFHIKPVANQPWRVVESRFRKALSDKRDAKIRVRIPNVSERWLTVRLRTQPKLQVRVDPHKLQYGLMMVHFVGPYPRWVEDDVVDEYVATSDTRGIATPALDNPTNSGTGGTLTAATYWYRLTALNAVGQTTSSNEVSEVTSGSTSRVFLTWAAVSGATGYKVYRSTGSGSETLLATLGAVTSYTDTGTATSGTPYPTTNTTIGPEVGSVTVSNPTNNEVWLRWVAQAGSSGIKWTIPDFSWGDDRFDRAVTDAGRMIVMPALIPNEHITVDTDEMTLAGQVVSDLDTQVYLRMNGIQFLYPLPPYTGPTEVPVSVQYADVGNGIQVRCPRTWSAPWGREG